MPAEQITITAGGLTLSADSSASASTSILDSKWPAPAPKPNLLDGPDGSARLEEEMAYEDRTVTLTLASHAGSSIGADEWAGSWDEISAAASSDRSAVLASTFPNGVTLRFEILSAQFECERGHEHFIGEPTGELTLKCRPFGRDDAWTATWSTSTVGGFATRKLSVPVPGDVPALVSATTTWDAAPPATWRYVLGETAPTVVWGGEDVTSGSSIGLRSDLESRQAFIPPSPVPVAQTANIPPGRWLIGSRCAAFRRSFTPASGALIDELVEVALTVNGRLVTPWRPVGGRVSVAGVTEQDAELFSYIEFPVQIEDALSLVAIVARSVAGPGSLPEFWVQGPVVMDACRGVAAAAVDPSALRGTDAKTIIAPLMDGDTLTTVAIAGGIDPTGEIYAHQTTGMESDGADGLRGALYAVTAVAIYGFDDEEPLPIPSADYVEMSVDVRFPTASIAGASDLPSSAGGGLTIGAAYSGYSFEDPTVDPDPGGATTASAWRGVAVDLTPAKVTAAVRRASNGALGGYTSKSSGIVGGAWYQLRVVHDGTGRWWVYLSPVGMQPVLVACGESPTIPEAVGVPAVRLVRSAAAGKSPTIRNLQLAYSSIAKPPVPKWGEDGSARGPKPTARPRTRPVIVARATSSESRDHSGWRYLMGIAPSMKVVPRYLQVPHG